METLANILVGVVALEHLYILYLEMFAWETKGKKAFKGSLRPELFAPTRVLAANQGLYNGFLAAGLIWSFNCRRGVWRPYCQQKDIFYSGAAGFDCIGCSVGRQVNFNCRVYKT
jgi:uncharacterized membrane protein